MHTVAKPDGIGQLDAIAQRDAALRAALDIGLLSSDAPIAAMIDLDDLACNVAALRSAFPADLEVLHAFAAKANPLVKVLEHLRLLGMGCEVASLGELAQAVSAGHEPDRIVFDSPAKTVEELRLALRLGIAINVDSFQELERVARLREEGPSASRIGMRVNPQVGLGDIEAMSTAGTRSKFGIALEDEGARHRILDAFESLPWLTAMHVHTGSQGCPLPLIGEGIARIVELADTANAARAASIDTIDIGGGMPVDFDADDTTADFAGYVDQLRESAPRVLSGDYRLVTEFGRSVIAKQGWIAARVEYTKQSGDRRIAITHAGAHVATRTVFAPAAWPLRVVGRDSMGHPLARETMRQDVAGPCCFAGDVVARDRELPLLAPGDWIQLLDTGAYYASAPFGYNSILEPGVYGYQRSEDGTAFETLRAPQSLDDLIRRTGGSTAPF